MADVEFHFDLDRFEREIKLEIFGHDLEAAAEDMGRRLAARVRTLIELRAQHTTPGGLSDSVHGQVFSTDDGETWDILVLSEEDHAIWFEEGTGLFGPRHAFIVPHGTHPMIFQSTHFIGQKIVAFKVAGQEGKHPFKDALNETQFRFVLKNN